MNEALKVSCQQGLPVRVVRSYKVPTLTQHALDLAYAEFQLSPLLRLPTKRCLL